MGIFICCYYIGRYSRFRGWGIEGDVGRGGGYSVCF